MLEDDLGQVSQTPIFVPAIKDRETVAGSGILEFSGVDGQDVYNCSAPFNDNGRTLLAGRVQPRESVLNSKTMFFEEKDGIWTPVKGAPVLLNLEDPFVTHIGGELILTGVEVYSNRTKENPEGLGYRTIFYGGQDIFLLTKFAVGPDMMKDIRLTQLPNDRIAIFTRPQGGKNGRGRIGYTEISKLEDLNKEIILQAKIIENQFGEGQWGGVNELHPLPDGAIGVIGHIANFGPESRKIYKAMSFIYNPTKHAASPINILTTRQDFPPGPAKTKETENVVFPSAMVSLGNGNAVLSAGLSDAKEGYSPIKDPFWAYVMIIYAKDHSIPLVG